MKEPKSFPITLLIILFLVSFFTSCKMAQLDTHSATSLSGPMGPNSRKVIYSANIILSVENPDSANNHIKKIAKEFGGYVNEIGTERSVIRVKSENLNIALERLSTLGKVQSKSQHGQDVTEEYTNYQIRLENAEKARARYLELLAKAENVEAALKVEKELERLNETIDLLKGKMNSIDHLSEFFTITINLKERKKPGIIGYIGVGIYEGIKWLFVRS